MRLLIGLKKEINARMKKGKQLFSPGMKGVPRKKSVLIL